MSNVSRRDFLRVAGGAAAGAVVACHPAPRRAMGSSGGTTVYVGTYTRGKSEGIYVGRFDAGTGSLRVDRVVRGVINPSFLALDPAGGRLYAVNEIGEFEGEKSGSVTAFAVDRSTGDLRELNRRSSRGGAPCFVTVDPGGRYALVANYSGGNAAVLPIGADGALGAAVSVVRHQGSGPNRQRQDAPHVHSVTLDPAARFALVADLGIDRVAVYRFDAATGALAAAGEAVLEPGSGPRHLDFHPDGDRVYVINELSSTVTAFRYDPGSGKLTPTQTVSTLPSGFSGRNSCADIHVHRSGRFLYGSNRGHDSIVVFAISPESGQLSVVQHQSTLGKTPRNFAIDPTGRFLLAANQDSDSVAVFAIDQRTGRLEPSGPVVEVPVPVCLRFA